MTEIYLISYLKLLAYNNDLFLSLFFRYRKSLVNGGRKCHTVVPPLPEGYPRADKLPPYQVSSDLIFFCRQIYDFRQKKILKKPPSQPHPRS